MATLKGALKSQSPDWAVVQKETKTYAKFAADMPKNDPPKGDAASYKKLAKAFASNAKALDDAAKKEDLAGHEGRLRQDRRVVHGLPQSPQGRLSDLRESTSPSGERACRPGEGRSRQRPARRLIRPSAPSSRLGRRPRAPLDHG